MGKFTRGDRVVTSYRRWDSLRRYLASDYLCYRLDEEREQEGVARERFGFYCDARASSLEADEVSHTLVVYDKQL